MKQNEMPPILRTADVLDAMEIAALVNRAYRPAGPAQGWTHESNLVAGSRISTEQVLSLFVPQSRILVLCAAHTIIACVHIQAEGASACIGMLATEPVIQAQGLGKQMLAHAEQFAAEQFNASVFKMSVLSSRPELTAFYERRGYVKTGEIQGYPVSAGVGQPRVEGLVLIALSKERLSSVDVFIDH